MKNGHRQLKGWSMKNGHNFPDAPSICRASFHFPDAQMQGWSITNWHRQLQGRRGLFTCRIV